MGQFFPKFTVRDVECGHWVISQKPNEFLELSEEFIKRDVDDDE